MHPAHSYFRRRERYALHESAIPTLKPAGLKALHGYLRQIDGKLAGRQRFGEEYSVLDRYGFVLYAWGVRNELPMAGLENYTIFKDPCPSAPPCSAWSRTRN